MSSPLRILVTGSRTWSRPDHIENVLDLLGSLSHAQQHGVVLVHGGAKGADVMAAAHAKRKGWQIEIHRALWDVYGRRAGYVRNRKMVDLGADVCVAFVRDGSPGASMTAAMAHEAEIVTWMVDHETGKVTPEVSWTGRF